MPKMPILETDRLILRPLTLDDVEALFALTSIPEVIRYINSRPSASLDDARRYLEAGALHDYATQGYGRHAIVLKESGEVIGFHGFKFMPELGETELGYRLLPAHWGKGLASEAAKVLVAHGWSELGLRRIVSVIHPENEPSKNVVRKLGMAFLRSVRVSFAPEREFELYGIDRPAGAV